jgi:hypothetical protein
VGPRGNVSLASTGSKYRSGSTHGKTKNTKTLGISFTETELGKPQTPQYPCISPPAYPHVVGLPTTTFRLPAPEAVSLSGSSGVHRLPALAPRAPEHLALAGGAVSSKRTAGAQLAGGAVSSKRTAGAAEQLARNAQPERIAQPMSHDLSVCRSFGFGPRSHEP